MLDTRFIHNFNNAQFGTIIGYFNCNGYMKAGEYWIF